MQTHRSLNWKTMSLVLLVAALLVSAVAMPVAAQTPVQPNVPSITVSGFGEASGDPDVAYITLGADIATSDVAEAVAQANTEIDAIIAAITETGVAAEDIQTTNFSVWPEDRSDPQTGMPTGERVYHVQNQVNITVRDIEQIGTVIEAGLSAGADSVYGLSFGIDDRAALEQEARLEAIADAQDRAAKLAEAMGVTVGEPIIISETFGNFPLPYASFDVARGLGGGGGEPPISAGQLSVSVQVNVTFAIGE
jgi:uncharacterized protein YggE